MGGLLKTIISVGVILLLFIIAWKILRFAVAVLFPIAIVVIAAYLVYNFIRNRA